MNKGKIIQLMRPGAFGDLLMCTAALPGLKSMGYRIRFVVDPEYANILSGHPCIDELVTSTEGTREGMIKQTEKLPQAERYVYLYYPFYAKRDLPPHPIPLHICNYYCEQSGVPGNDSLSVHLSDRHLSAAQKYKNAVLIHCKSRWSPYKDWPEDRWEKLAELLSSQLEMDVFQLGGPDEKTINGARKADTPSILDAIAAVSECRLFIGVDSVFNHATRAVGKPSIIIWGSTHPSSTGYRQNINLVNGVAWQPEMGAFGPTLNCQPCYREYPRNKNGSSKSPCPYTVPYPVRVLPEILHKEKVLNACLASTSVETVFYHARAMLSNPRHAESMAAPAFKKNRMT